MKLLSIESLAIPDIKIITYQHFCNPRGYFTEHFRKSQFKELPFMQGFEVKRFYVPPIHMQPLKQQLR